MRHGDSILSDSVQSGDTSPVVGRPRLVLHIGTHKTGTTTIQKFAAANRAALSEKGLHYPALVPSFGPRNPGHHHLAHALSDEGSPSVTRDEALAFIDKARKDADGRTVLLSAEPFFRHVLGARGDADYWTARHAYIRAVAEALSGFDVTVMVVFRRLDDFVQSLYKESVLQSRYARPIEDFVRERITSFEYGRQLDLWEDVFGKKALLISLYDKSVRGRATVDQFFALLGVDTTGIGGNVSGEANVSASPMAVEVKRLINAHPLHGRQSLKMRGLLELLQENPRFKDLLAGAFRSQRMSFDQTGTLHAEMTALLARLPQSPARDTCMNGWNTEFDQPVPVDPTRVEILVQTLLATANAHFHMMAEAHLAYADWFAKAGNVRQAMLANAWALEYEPQRIDLYLAMLDHLPMTDSGERKKVLALASKELNGKDYAELRERSGLE